MSSNPCIYMDTEVETINCRLGLRTAVWLQAKVRDRALGCGLGYMPDICDESSAEAAYAATVAL